MGRWAAGGGRWERWALGAIALGVALRLASPFLMDLGYDANTYAATGYGWWTTRHFVLPYGDVLTFGPSGPGYSHHFPPGYPLYLGLFYTAFGFGLAQTKLAGVVISLAALGIVWWTTRDLYGRERALLVTAAVALAPWLFWLTGMGFSENLALALFTLTMWAIVKSLGDERFIVLAGVFAGLAYLTRASMGAFFLIAGLGGALWRVWHRGWRAFTSVWYGLAILVFGSLFFAWAWRNVALFGWPNWETSIGSRGIPQWIVDHQAKFAGSVLARGAMLLAVLAPMLALLWPEARAAWRRVREEHTSALWLSVLLVYVLGVLFAAAYLSMGGWEDVPRLDNMRYVVIALVPLAWLLARETDVTDARAMRRWAALGVVSLLLCAFVVAYPAHYLPAEAARAMDPFLEKGDLVLVEGAGKYPFFAYLSHPEDVTVHVAGYSPRGEEPAFIVRLYAGATPEGYVLEAEKTERHPWFGSDDAVQVFARADVAASRGVHLAPLRAGW